MMKDAASKLPLLLTAAILALPGPLLHAQDEMQLSPYAGMESWQNDREERLAWFRDARFGMMIHLGLYSAAAGEWPPGVTDENGDARRRPEWIRTWATIDEPAYGNTLKPLFQPAPGCTDEWAALAKEAGMRYAILTAKSEEGYTLFNSKSRDAAGQTGNISPPGRDLFGEFVASMRKQQLMPGVYYSLVDWRNPGTSIAPPYLSEQIKEIATGYGPLGILWVDGSEAGLEGAHWGTRSLLEIWREHQPASVINNRFWNGLENPNGDFMTPEKYVLPAAIGDRMFEVRQSIDDHFGYSGGKGHWKSAKEILQLLSDVASKGGNLQIGIGADAKGRIPDQAAETLRATGRWLKTHGEAIYATKATIFPIPVFNGRCTVAERKGEHILYCHLYEWPANGVISLDGLTTRCSSATLLGERPQDLQVSNLSWPSIHLPKTAPDPDDPLPVIAVRLEGAPVLDPIPYPRQGIDHTVTLNASQAILVVGEGSGKNALRMEDQHIGWWSQISDSVWFPVMIREPGKFRVILNASVGGGCGGEIEMRLLDQTLRQTVTWTGQWTDFRDFEMGDLKITQPGLNVIHVRPLRIDGYGLMNLRQIRMVPLDEGG